MSDADERQDEKARLRAEAAQLLGRDLFGILDLPRTASTEDVRRAYITAAKKWHPDRAPRSDDELRRLFEKVFARLDLARVTLSDPAERARVVAGARDGRLDKDGALASRADAATFEAKKAEAFLKKNDRATATQHLERAVRLAPANAEYRATLLSMVLLEPTSPPDKLEATLVELDDLAKRDPACERVFFVRGQVRKRLGREREAFADFSRAAELNPNNLDATREVRIYKMRAERPTTPASSTGALGFIKKLFKR